VHFQTARIVHFGTASDIGEYKRHRHAFSSFEEFIEWFNNRPHGSLEWAKFAAMPHEWIACPFSGLVPIKENLI
jgi:hypothetical protein